MQDKKQLFLKGMHHGIPVALGYLAVSFTLGIAAKRAGFTPIQAMLMSLTSNASASEFSAINLIKNGSAYIEIALTTLILNLRYILMSCALSQKLSSKTGIGHRLAISFDITDEIFALSVCQRNGLSPYYTYGIIAAALPCWAMGTFLGTLSGSILPASVMSAMNVALYCMFIAIVLPPAKENKIVGFLVIISMAASTLFTYLPGLKQLSSGTMIITLTVVISLAAAVLFPIEEKDDKKAVEKEASVSCESR